MILRKTVFGGIIATVLNVLLYLIGLISGVDYLVRIPTSSTPQFVSIIAIIFATAFGGALTYFCYVALARLFNDPRSIWIFVCMIGTAISIILPLSTGITLETTVLLSAMHIIAGGVYAYYLGLFETTGQTNLSAELETETL